MKNDLPSPSCGSSDAVVLPVFVSVSEVFLSPPPAVESSPSGGSARSPDPW